MLKIKIMKKILLIIYIIIVPINLTAQILPVEQLNELTESVQDQVDSITHIKDVNGVLDKFVGTWKGSFDGKQLEVVIKKITRDHSQYVNYFHPEPLLWDQLIAKHKLTDQNGNVIYSTLDLPDGSPGIMYKRSYRNSYTYSFNYYGKDFKCGDNGVVIIKVNNDTQVHFLYSHSGSQSPSCTTGPVDPVFPKVATVTLTKQ